ncbi:MAG: PleD family two-component system response regulator [Candidatus Methylomirabilales bacterium]
MEDDGLVTGKMARTLRQAGHVPILAPDAQSALDEAADRPDVILFDLGLPDLPVKELLERLQSQPNTAHIPVLVITGEGEAAAYLREDGRVADVLLKPVSGVKLREAVDTILATQEQPDAEALRLDRQRQREVILRLIVEGPDPLVFHISRRLCADRTNARRSIHAETLTWADIAEWGKREGLLDAEQASLLRRVPLSAAPRAGECAA